MSRLLASALLTVTLLGALSGCSAEPDGSARAPVESPPASSPSATPTVAAPPPPAPSPGACHRLSYDQAVAPTAPGAETPCTDTHTTETFVVGRLDTVVDGRLLAVDSERAQQQVSTDCPARLAGFVGGSEEDRRLSMLRSVWFTPTVEQSDAGANWFRCDVVALAADGRLQPVTGSLSGVLDTEEGRIRYGVCGTAEPGTDAFARVVCASPHAWRAIRTVPLSGDAYPGVAVVQAAGEEPCRSAAKARAADPLDFQWGYEWPTAEQWQGGQRHGLCWVPD